jgi:hypothetical protein
MGGVLTYKTAQQKALDAFYVTVYTLGAFMSITKETTVRS